MNIREKLESAHSKAVTEAVFKYIGGDAKKFKILFDLFISGTPVQVQRAAPVFARAVIQWPRLMNKCYPAVFKKLLRSDNHDAVNRNVLKIFQEIEIPAKYEGPVVDLCFKHLADPTASIAIRAFAITAAARICKKYPELANELILMLREIAALPHPPAIGVRLKLALKELLPANSKV